MTPFVLVHGFMGGSAQWQQQVHALPTRLVITPDLPGFGLNAHLDGLDRIDGFAAHVLAELTAKGIDRFHLMGHSMGGMVAQEMVAQAPERIGRLILYGTGATGVLPGRFETIETSKQRTINEGARATARRIAATWFLNREKAPAYEDCARIAEVSSEQAMLAGLDAMEAWSRATTLPNIRANTLIIWGDRDRTYSWQQTKQLWQTIPETSLAVIPGCAHAVHLEKPELFNSIMTDFIDA